MLFSSVAPAAARRLARQAALFTGVGLSFCATLSSAELISNYNFGVMNRLQGAQGMALPPPQPVSRAEGSGSGDQGALVEFSGVPLGIPFPDLPGSVGSGATGPLPRVSARAEATGLALRTAASLEYDRGLCPQVDCVYVDGSAFWSLSWNVIARAEARDTITIDVAGFDGLAGQFVLPYEFTGTTTLENDSRMSVRASTNFVVTSFDDEGNRTVLNGAVANAGPVRTGPVNRVDDVSNRITIPFVFGEPFRLNTSLSSEVGALQGSNFLDSFNRVFAEADFFNTARLNPFENFQVDSDRDGLFDSAVDSALLNITSLLNVDYLALADSGGGSGGSDPVDPPVTVAEPGTLWMSTLACLALLRLRRPRRQRHARRLPSRSPRAIVPTCLKPLTRKRPVKSPSCCAVARAVKSTR